jgi:AcrR family transcriptional regulator
MARPRQISDEDILTTARSMFLEHGPQVSIQVVADRLGVSQAAVFKRFGTKVELMVAALVPAPPPFLDDLLVGPDDRPIQLQLQEMAGAMSLYFDQTFPCFAVLKSSGVNIDAALLECKGEAVPLRTHRALTTWMTIAQRRHLIRDVDPSAIATMVMGALHSHAFLAHFLGAQLGSSADHVRRMVDVVWTGIRPEESP